MWSVLCGLALAAPPEAWAAVSRLEDELGRFSQITYTDNNQANVDRLIQQKPAELKALEELGQTISEQYSEPDVSAAVLFLTGAGYIQFAEMIERIPSPEGLDAESEVLYRESLDAYRLPVEDKGRYRLERSVAADPDGEWAARSAALLEALP